MTNDEINQLMSDHLNDLKETAEDCDEELLTPITSAMISTAALLVQMNKSELSGENDEI